MQILHAPPTHSSLPHLMHTKIHSIVANRMPLKCILFWFDKFHCAFIRLPFHSCKFNRLLSLLYHKLGNRLNLMGDIQHRLQCSTYLYWSKFCLRYFLQIAGPTQRGSAIMKGIISKLSIIQLGYNRTLARDVPINRYCWRVLDSRFYYHLIMCY